MDCRGLFPSITALATVVFANAELHPGAGDVAPQFDESCVFDSSAGARLEL
jgi:hypothetical protein